MDEKILKIRKHLKKKLDPYRYEHTLGVVFTCQALAMRYGFDLKKAELAGLLHDCAKRFDGRVMLEKCERHGIVVSEGERRDPSLLHAKLGAWYAKEKYGVTDVEILSAIACHTTGKPGMTLLDKILYVADYIEPRRNKADNLTEMRRLAFLDLDLACLKIMEHILSYLESRDCSIDAITVAACVDMRRIVKEGADCRLEAKKEEMTDESTGKRNGKNCRRRSGGEKRRGYKGY